MIDERRIKLDAKLRELLGSDKVYFQPPESVSMEYPCIRYNLAKVPVDFADNGVYLIHAKYVITFISPEPDDNTKERLVLGLNCPIIQVYAADGLYHYVYELYY